VRSRKLLLATAIVGALALTACSKEPKGQIVAVVNGDEVSMQELNAELAGVRIPDNADRAALRRQILERIIDRKLIVQKAREQGIDKTPDYVSQQRRLEENLLVSMLGQKIAQTVPMPDDRDVTQYIADNPTMFGQRQRLLLDQIQFEAPKNSKQLLNLRDAHSLDDIAAALGKMGLASSRGRGVIDTGRLDPQLMSKINQLPAGEPFVLPSNGSFVASVIVGRDLISTPTDVQRQVAIEAVRRRALFNESKAQVQRARGQAEIKYQPGFEPLKTPAAKKADAAVVADDPAATKPQIPDDPAALDTPVGANPAAAPAPAPAMDTPK
jgi:EpsD family peptidyl-prolyl cis-trans isomerase